MKFFTKTVFGLGLLFLTSSVFAADGFYVRHISFQGLQQLNAASAMHYLPFHAGEQLTSAKSAQLISALYKTGFFSDVEFYRSGDTLIIRVQERPTISELTFKGNKTITNDKLKPVLKNLKLQVGGFYDPAILNQLKQGLLAQYNNIGFYAVQVQIDVKNLPRNRVAIVIHVIEGKLAKVHSIQFTGNHAFSSHVLREQMKMRRTGLFSWFTQTDRYSDYAVDQEAQNLQKFHNPFR